ncbi:dentin sialophosphoprotein-like [Teleopsis dalmanni]|uniref:dentin sialophosphoprotein-like n=1 Tax=Teleopsis dalmanni TaxID=139649 RepID=UPI0018CDA7D1|nr:dentin sialophosphoprotein-like [Teleopsis dalmanni]
MFARFRNLFSKSKPDPEPGPEDNTGATKENGIEIPIIEVTNEDDKDEILIHSNGILEQENKKKIQSLDDTIDDLQKTVDEYLSNDIGIENDNYGESEINVDKIKENNSTEESANNLESTTSSAKGVEEKLLKSTDLSEVNKTNKETAEVEEKSQNKIRKEVKSVSFDLDIEYIDDNASEVENEIVENQPESSVDNSNEAEKADNQIVETASEALADSITVDNDTAEDMPRYLDDSSNTASNDIRENAHEASVDSSNEVNNETVENSPRSLADSSNEAESEIIDNTHETSIDSSNEINNQTTENAHEASVDSSNEVNNQTVENSPRSLADSSNEEADSEIIDNAHEISIDSSNEINNQTTENAPKSLVDNSNKVNNDIVENIAEFSVESSTNEISSIENDKDITNETEIKSYNVENDNTFMSTEYPKVDTIENLQNLTLNNYSVVADDLSSDTPNSVGETDVENNAQDENTSATTSSTIIVQPTANNEIGCKAISQKLTDIAEVAESLDAVIRDIQNDSDVLDINSNSSERKLETLRSNSSEDWHSRSTEDDSFATASEGNFTPHSQSSSFQTASGRTSSFISSDKNSFDASEADDSTFAFDMPELASPVNMSYDGSEHSFLSALQTSPILLQHQQQQQQLLYENDNVIGAAAGIQNANNDDQASVADIEDLHSESVTPTPDDNQRIFNSIQIESETELESCIADAPSMEILTELEPVTSVTPEKF